MLMIDNGRKGRSRTVQLKPFGLSRPKIETREKGCLDHSPNSLLKVLQVKEQCVSIRREYA